MDTSDQKRLYRAIGLMSGTSMDGIDAALLETDGDHELKPGAGLAVDYDEAFREALRGVMGGQGALAEVERDLTLRHADAVRRLLDLAGLEAGDIDLIGFHGQTVLHEPEAGRTWQIGDGQLLARELSIPVVNDFRAEDVAAGGQGAPLAPVYHRALVAAEAKPVAVLNLGGIANVTWIGEGESDLIAFDTGPSNALLDDWVRSRLALPYDRDGKLGLAGRVDAATLSALLDAPYFARRPPKSLDRFDFSLDPVMHLSDEDGAATLTAFTAESVARSLSLLPAPPLRLIACGGGRKNPAIMRALDARCGCPVIAAEEAGWNGDLLEAQAFAYMAVRSRLGLALSFPGTTGVPRPLTGGRFHRP